jgi:hypothetical protein
MTWRIVQDPINNGVDFARRFPDIDQIQVHAEKRIQSVTVKEKLTVFINYFEIPLRTGCDAAALSILPKWPPGPGWIAALRIRFLNSVQNAASRVSEVNSMDKGGGSPYSG